MKQTDFKSMNKHEIINAKAFGKNIRNIRDEMKLTREMFSELTGVSVDYLGKIERGQEIPSLVICVKIADTLNTTIDFLLYNEVDTVSFEINENKLNKIIATMTINEKKFFIDVVELYRLNKLGDCD